jgi:hypothetical protein
MSPTGALGAAQAGTGRIYAIRSLVGELPGDYNVNGLVDAADYVLWRDTQGSMSQLAADGDRSGAVDAADYNVWRQNFGLTSASAAAVGQASRRVLAPEPDTIILALFGVSLHTSTRWRKKSRKTIDEVIIDRLK